MASLSRRDALHIILLLAATAICYASAINTAFVFDDTDYIVNTTRFDPVSKQVITGRRVVPQLTFLANYWTSKWLTGDGRDPRAFKATNVLIHAGAGLVIWGLARRAMSRSPLRERVGDAGPFIAFAIALLWLVHPLQTQAITYVIQRMESLMSLMALLVIYCVARIDDARGRGSRVVWAFAGLVFCLLGTMSKESMIVAPILALLYDRTFIAGTFGGALRARWWYYASLVLILTTPWWLFSSVHEIAQGESGAAGFGIKILSPKTYFLSQPGVILAYLGQVVWPKTLCIDWYWRPSSTPGEIVPPLIVVGLLGCATLLALVRWPIVGFLGAWFVIALGPTSSFLPIGDLRVEHRMYLAILACAALAVIGVARLFGAIARSSPSMKPRVGTIAAAALLLVAAALGARTITRNRDYATPASLWASTLMVRPSNDRALNNFGAALAEDARRHQRPVDTTLLARVADAIASAAASNPDDPEQYATLGMIYSDMQSPDRAEQAFRTALARDPDHDRANYRLGILLMNRGDLGGAAECFGRAIKRQPEGDQSYNALGAIRVRQNRLDEAERVFKDGLSRNPHSPKLHANLGQVLLMRGRAEDSLAHFAKAAEIEPVNTAHALSLARALMMSGKEPQAIETLEDILKREPRNADAFAALAALKMKLGIDDAAVTAYVKSLEAKPNDPMARFNLATLLVQAGRNEDAMKHLRVAVELRPDFAPAKQLLDQLRQASTRPR